MKIARTFSTIALSSVMALSYAGVAFADDSVSVSNTGPSSSNNAQVNNNNTFTSDVSNSISIDNDNDQHATSGDANVSGNTNGGSAVSGIATNNNTTSTVVSIDNPGAGLGNGGNNGGNPGGSGNGGNNGGSGGSVLGASTGSGFGAGAGTLPAVGASDPVNVSALRTLLSPSAATHGSNALVKQSRGISATFLVLAALLSLIGAFGSAVYAQRRENRV